MEFKITFSLVQSFEFHVSHRVQSFHVTSAHVLAQGSRPLNAISVLLLELFGTLVTCFVHSLIATEMRYEASTPKDLMMPTQSLLPTSVF